MFLGKHFVLHTLGLIAALVLFVWYIQYRPFTYIALVFFTACLTIDLWYLLCFVRIAVRARRCNNATPYNSVYRKEMRSEFQALTGRIQFRSNEPQFRSLKEFVKPTRSPVIFVVNHYSRTNRTEVIPLSALLPKNTTITHIRGAHVMVDNHLHFHAIDWIVHKNAKKGEASQKFLHECKQIVARGHNVLIYPEGKNNFHKREFSNNVSYQSGAFLLSKQENIPIVPIVLSEDWAPWRKYLPHPRPLHIKILRAMYPTEFDTAQEMRETCRMRVRKVEKRFAVGA